MMQYIEPNDYDASVHREIIDAITREDNSILDICEDRAIEIHCYLCYSVIRKALSCKCSGHAPSSASHSVCRPEEVQFLSSSGWS